MNMTFVPAQPNDVVTIAFLKEGELEKLQLHVRAWAVGGSPSYSICIPIIVGRGIEPYDYVKVLWEEADKTILVFNSGGEGRSKRLRSMDDALAFAKEDLLKWLEEDEKRKAKEEERQKEAKARGEKPEEVPF